VSIRYGILALLRRGPMHGYQLRAAFEASTGGTWPLNIGQIYTTLGRLERDGLVAAVPGAGTAQRPYRLTAAGDADLGGWFTTPITGADRPRDELAIKLSLALGTPGVDVHAVLRAQRAATVRTLLEYQRQEPDPDHPAGLSWRLVRDAMVFRTEAEISWLDHCETLLASAAGSRGATKGRRPAPRGGGPADHRRQ
jgi:DNA-binding PadR family transcriptional regulator